LRVDTAVPGSYDSTMAMWRCPHCATPQAETARCWVCHRSSTTCSTCRHFRTSLAADVGYCAKDRWRTPLTGLELRACWEEGRRATTNADQGAAAPVGRDDFARRPGASVRGDGGLLDRPNAMRLRGFVPIEELAAAEAALEDGGVRAPRPAAPERARQTRRAPSLPVDPLEDWERRVSLFGDAEA
jgi:hypothetical protein